MIISQVAAATRLVAVDLEDHVGHLMKRFGAAKRFLVNRSESPQAFEPRMLAEARALEDTVIGEAVDPFLELSVVDGVCIPRIELANLFTILECSGDSPHFSPRAKKVRLHSPRASVPRRPSYNQAVRSVVIRCARP